MLKQLYSTSSDESVKFYSADATPDRYFKFYSAGDVQCYIFSTESFIVISFRGSEPFNPGDWIADLTKSLIPLPSSSSDTSHPNHFSPMAKVHEGFYSGLLGMTDNTTNKKPLWLKISDKIDKMEEGKNKPKQIYVTGHSYGGSLATVFSYLILEYGCDYIKKNFVGVYSFGAPRCFNLDGAMKYNSLVARQQLLGDITYRFIIQDEFAPRFPWSDTDMYYLSTYDNKNQTAFTTMLKFFGVFATAESKSYCHVGNQLHFVNDGEQYKLQILLPAKEEEIVKPTEPFKEIPMKLDPENWTPLRRLLCSAKNRSFIYNHFPDEYERYCKSIRKENK